MAKNKVFYAASALALLSGVSFWSSVPTHADSTVLESCEGIEDCAIVTSTAELSAAFSAQKSTIIMGSSFDLTADLRTSANMSLYLNNYTLTSDGWSIINVDGNLTIYAGENGKIVETGGTYAPLYVYNNTTLKSGTFETAGQSVYVGYDTGVFTMDGGMITGGNSSSSTTNVSDGAKFIMNNGEINADTWGVSVFKNAEFEMNGGMIVVSSSEGIGVAGNGSVSGKNEGTNAKITLNSGIINSGDVGVYAPQIGGETVINEGMLVAAGKCGVEVRAGSLTVDGATIEVDAGTPYEFNPNSNGSTATGVAIAVAQHTTKQAISATVIGGTFTAPVAFAESNPQRNNEEDVEKVELSITGGTFNATNGKPVVASEDVEKFITGGIYNKVPEAQYIDDNRTVYGLPENYYTVDVLPSATYPEAVYVQVGESVDVETIITPDYYAIGVVDDKAVYDADAGTITGVTAGNTEVMITWYDTNNTAASFPVYVYEIAPEETEEIEGGEDAVTIQQTAAEQIANFLETGESATDDAIFYSQDDLKEAIAQGKEIVSVVNTNTIDMDNEEWLEHEKANFEDVVEEGEQFAMIYFVSVPVFSGELNTEGAVYYGELLRLKAPITMRYVIPAGLPEVEEGFKRVFTMIRRHYANNEARNERLETRVEGDDVVFENDLFSDFALVYADVEDESGEDEPSEDEPGENEPGEDEPSEEPTDEPSDEPTDEPTEGTEGESEEESASTPDTGTITAAGASAMNASLVAAVAVGVITAISSFVFLVQRRND